MTVTATRASEEQAIVPCAPGAKHPGGDSFPSPSIFTSKSTSTCPHRSRALPEHQRDRLRVSTPGEEGRVLIHGEPALELQLQAPERGIDESVHRLDPRLRVHDPAGVGRAEPSGCLLLLRLRRFLDPDRPPVIPHVDQLLPPDLSVRSDPDPSAAVAVVEKEASAAELRLPLLVVQGVDHPLDRIHHRFVDRVVPPTGAPP